jgi:hypothetical protein
MVAVGERNPVTRCRRGAHQEAAEQAGREVERVELATPAHAPLMPPHHIGFRLPLGRFAAATCAHGRLLAAVRAGGARQAQPGIRESRRERGLLSYRRGIRAHLCRARLASMASSATSREQVWHVEMIDVCSRKLIRGIDCSLLGAIRSPLPAISQCATKHLDRTARTPRRILSGF